MTEDSKFDFDKTVIDAYGQMSDSELMRIAFNEESKRCAEATDEELAIRLRAIHIMQVRLKSRQHAIDTIDNDRKESRTRKEREERKELDKKLQPVLDNQPKTKKTETFNERVERELKEKKEKEDSAIQKLMKATKISLEQATAIVKGIRK